MLIPSVLDVAPFRTLVDIGCGDGILLLALARRYPAARLVGAEPDAAKAAAAMARIRSNAEQHRVGIVRGDALNTGLAPGWADVVVFQLVLHHVVDTAGAIREAVRIVAPGGRVLIKDGSRLTEAEFIAMNTQLTRAGLPPEPLPGIDPSELAAMLTQAGMVVEPIRWDGTMTFATPPFTDRDYAVPRFLLVGRHPPP